MAILKVITATNDSSREIIIGDRLAAAVSQLVQYAHASVQFARASV